MATLTHIHAREILDSRGHPTVEVLAELSDGERVVASVPSGASTGTHEALELRDGDKSRYQGKGVLRAVSHVNDILAPALIGMEATEQQAIDATMRELDGTENKSRLGANALLGVSLAVARGAAQSSGLSLFRYLATLRNFKTAAGAFPVPMFNVVNGGEHADSGLSVQEFKIVPSGIGGYSEQLRAGSEIFHALQALLRKEGYTTDVGDEGGFAPRLKSHTECFELLMQATEACHYVPGKEIFFDIDAAANSFYAKDEERYVLEPEKAKLEYAAMASLYQEWMDRFPLVSIEDPFHEEDWAGWRRFNEKVGNRLMLVGDDLLVTNVKRLQKAILENACNAVLIKVNQIGTLTETLDCIELAQARGMKTVISHRSGETTDDFIADLAVGTGAQFIKTGSLARGERLAKYNRLLAIDHEMRTGERLW